MGHGGVGLLTLADGPRASVLLSFALKFGQSRGPSTGANIQLSVVQPAGKRPL